MKGKKPGERENSNDWINGCGARYQLSAELQTFHPLLFRIALGAILCEDTGKKVRKMERL